MSTQSPLPGEPQLPATFAARGVALPATTPLLAGVRVRASTAGGAELVVPNLAGGSGYYVLALPGIRSVCLPTVHDTVLLGHVARLPAITPDRVRGAALRVACEGYAGPEAANAATAALAADRAQRRRIQSTLVAKLAASIDPDAPAAAAADLQARTDVVLRRLAAALGCPPGKLANGLRALVEAWVPAGLAHHEAAARLPRLVQRLRATRLDLRRWLDANEGGDVGGLGRTIEASLRSAEESGATALRRTWEAFGNPLELLRRWTGDPQRVMAFVTRCDWLLDGWDTTCLVWLTAQTDADRSAALLEMPLTIPPLPQEAAAWTDLRVPLPDAAPICQVTSYRDDWRIGGAALPLIERNERLRAMSV